MGGGGGAPSQEANRCSPSGVSQMADIKKRVFFGWGGGGVEGGGGGGGAAAAAAAGAEEEDENIPQDEQATEFLSLLSFLDCDLCQFFSPPLF